MLRAIAAATSGSNLLGSQRGTRLAIRPGSAWLRKDPSAVENSGSPNRRATDRQLDEVAPPPGEDAKA